jgi:hypothetical protein
LSITDKVEKYGFDSIQEAVDHLNSTVMQGAPVGDVPDTTTADLTAARAKHDREKAVMTDEERAEQSKQITRQRKVVAPTENEPVAPVEKELAPSENKDAFDIPEMIQDVDASNLEGDYDEPFIAETINTMKKMADHLESIGKTVFAKGIRSTIEKNCSIRK